MYVCMYVCTKQFWKTTRTTTERFSSNSVRYCTRRKRGFLPSFFLDIINTSCYNALLSRVGRIVGVLDLPTLNRGPLFVCPCRIWDLKKMSFFLASPSTRRRKKDDIYPSFLPCLVFYRFAYQRRRSSDSSFDVEARGSIFFGGHRSEIAAPAKERKIYSNRKSILLPSIIPITRLCHVSIPRVFNK